MIKVNNKTINDYVIPKKERLNKKRLSEEDCIRINKLYNDEGYSYRELMKMYDVSMNVIYFTLHPEKRVEFNKKQSSKKIKDNNNAKKCKQYRERKKELLRQGRLDVK